MDVSLSSWGPRLGSTLPVLISLVLIVAVAYEAAGLTWTWLAPAPEVPPATTTPRGPAPGNTRSPTPRFGEQIAGVHMFGEPRTRETEAGRPPAQAQEAPETQLDLTLRGVLAQGGGDGLAIITDRQGDHRLYRVGDQLSGGVEIEAIYGDRVLLRRHGQLEALSLPKDDQEGVSLAQDSGGDLGQRLARYRETVVQDPRQLSQLVRASPVRRSGRFVGYRLTPRSQEQLFRSLGLQQGDVVTAVNGIELDRPEKGLMAARSLLDAEQLDITVLRNGREINIRQRIGG